MYYLSAFLEEDQVLGEELLLENVRSVILNRNTCVILAQGHVYECLNCGLI